MDTLVVALGPAFAAGFAIQRLLELIDPWMPEGAKKRVNGLIAIVVGAALAWAAELRVLDPLGVDDAEAADIVVTALVVSAGTEGFNSIIKFLGYKKEEKKAEAAVAKAAAPGTEVQQLERAV